MKALLIPISPDNWESKEMMVVVQQAKNSARKIRKRIDVRLERKRFSNACNRIEELALNYGSDNYLELGDDKTQLLLDELPKDGDAQFLFFEPIEVKRILQNGFLTELENKITENSGIVAILEPFAVGNISFQTKQREKKKQLKPPEPDYSTSDFDLKKRDEENKRFHQQIRMAIETGKPLGWINIEGGYLFSIDAEKLEKDLNEGIIAQPLAEKFIDVGYELLELFIRKKEDRWIIIDREKTYIIRKEGKKLNIYEEGENTGLVRHEALITAIREYIYVKEQPTKTVMVEVTKEVPDEEATRRRNSKWWYKFLPFLIPKKPIMKRIKVKEPRVTKLPIEPINIRFAYDDGSIGEKFPLFCLAPKRAPEGLPIIKAALISNRHFELDPEIDICIIRNSEISRREEASFAEQEQLSYNITDRFLRDYLKKSNGLELHLYHTGLEPAVIGTYRAILEILRESDLKFRGKLIVIPKMFRGYKRGFQDLKAWY
jgi:hypothetical protein